MLTSKYGIQIGIQTFGNPYKQGTIPCFSILTRNIFSYRDESQ